MTKIRAKVIGGKRLENKLAGVAKSAQKVVAKAVAVGAVQVTTEIKRSIQSGPKTGKTYRRGSIGGRVVGFRVKFIEGRAIKGSSIKRGIKGFSFHRASAPGEPPATDTGNLVRSISHKFERDRLKATIGVHDLTNVKYARALEFGFQEKDSRGRQGNLLPRPYIFPAFERMKPKVKERIRKAMRDVTQAAAANVRTARTP